MTDLASLLANSGQTNADFNFGKINDAYRLNDEYQAKVRQRDQFKNGVPTDANGNIDYNAIQKSLIQNGDVANAASLIGATAGAQDRASLANIDAPQARPTAQPAVVSPPSANRTATASVAPPLNKGGAQAATQPGPVSTGNDSIVGIVSAGGIPDELAGPIIQQVSAMSRLDPNAPIKDPAVLKRVSEVTQAAIARSRPPQAQPAPVQAAPAQEAPLAPQDDQILKRLTFLAASPDKSTAAAAKVRLEAYLESKKLTTEQKNAAASGMPMKDYLDRGDAATTERDILTKSILPRLDKSQETASAARDEINALHQARAQLDMPGGIVAGKFANEALTMKKIGSFFNLPDAAVANTESFKAAIGSRVLALVKGLGAGAGISNADRDFAAAMAGGNITLDEKSIRRILDIGEQAARVRIAQHGKTVENAVSTTESLKPYKSNYLVEAPGAYRKPEIPQAPASGSIQDGTTAFNKTTGERIKFQGGKWVPFT
jgi:plasmid stability protein